MEKRFFETWKVCMVGLIFVAFLIPSWVFAQGKEPVQYKIFRSEEFLKMVNPNPGQRLRSDILTAKDEAKNLNGIFGIRPPSTPGEKVSYHYHNNRESIIIIISGEGTSMIEGKPVPVKAGDIIYMRPMVKHGSMNYSGKEYRYMEFFTYPPLMSDFIEVK